MDAKHWQREEEEEQHHHQMLQQHGVGAQYHVLPAGVNVYACVCVCCINRYTDARGHVFNTTHAGMCLTT